jgi:hypothetical protein
MFLLFVEYLFIMTGNFKAQKFECFTCCKHLLSSTNLHLTGSFPKNAILSDFSGDVYIPKFFAMICNVNTPLCKLSSASAIMT